MKTGVLNDILRTDMAVESKLREIERLKATRERVTAVLRGEGGGATGARDRLGDVTCTILELEGELEKDIARSAQLRREFNAIALCAVTPTEYAVLCRRYLEGQSFGRIAREMHFSRSAIAKIHARALEKWKQMETKVDKSGQK